MQPAQSFPVGHFIQCSNINDLTVDKDDVARGGYWRKQFMYMGVLELYQAVVQLSSSSVLLLTFLERVTMLPNSKARLGPRHLCVRQKRTSKVYDFDVPCYLLRAIL